MLDVRASITIVVSLIMICRVPCRVIILTWKSNAINCKVLSQTHGSNYVFIFWNIIFSIIGSTLSSMSISSSAKTATSWQNCITPPFGISLGWTSIILGCIPKHGKKFGMDPKLRPSQTPTNHPSQFFWHVPHSEPN